jgi:hypothetical protein
MHLRHPNDDPQNCILETILEKEDSVLWTFFRSSEKGKMVPSVRFIFNHEMLFFLIFQTGEEVS